MYLPGTKMTDPEERDGQGRHVDDDDDRDRDEERGHEESVGSHPAEQRSMPGVNFINILSDNFLYESVLSSFYVLTVCV